MGSTRLIFILALGVTLRAGEPETAEAPKSKSEASATVTVTAEATPIDRVRTPNPVLVMDAEAIQTSPARTAAELLTELLPGQLTTYGGVGAGQSLYLNGTRSQDVVVLQDGIRISDGGSLGVDFSQFSLAGVDRMEVLTGPASTLYGADAHGGVVSLHSAGPAKAGFSGQLHLGAGTQGRQRAGIAAGYGWQGGWVRADLAGDRENQPTETANPFRQASGFLGLGQNLGESTLFTFGYRQQYAATPLPTNWGYDAMWNPARAYGYDRETQQRQTVTTGSFRSAWTDQFSTELNLGQVRSHRYYTDSHYEANAQRNQLNLSAAWKGQGWGLSGVLDGYEEGIWNADPGVKTEGRHTAFALEASWEPLKSLRLVASGRNQKDRINGLAGKAGLTESTENQTTWKAGANLLLDSGFRAYVNAGTSFNVPQLFQISWNASKGFAMPGNEQSRSTLLGLGWAKGPWDLRVDASRIAYDSLVSWVGGWSDGHYENQKQVRVQGVEGTVKYQVATWGAEAFARSQEGRDFSLPEAQQLSSFASRPFFMAGLRGNFVQGAWRFAGQAAYTGHRYAYDSDFGGMAPQKNHFVDLNLSAQWTLKQDLDLTLRAEHLLQSAFTRADWEQMVDRGQNNRGLLPGYPAQTRLFSAELRYRF